MSSSESEEEDYEVEKITGHRKQDGEYVFKVRWKGYDKDQDTWEPQSNLDNCQQAIDDYWARRNAEKEKKKLEEAGASGITPPGMSKIALKINASQHKFQIRISSKLTGFPKNVVCKSVLEFYIVYNSFHLKTLRPMLQKLRIAIFGQFWL